MSKQWTVSQSFDAVVYDGRHFHTGTPRSRKALSDRLNTLQAVADAAKVVAYGPRCGDIRHDSPVNLDMFLTKHGDALRTALARLESATPPEAQSQVMYRQVKGLK